MIEQKEWSSSLFCSIVGLCFLLVPISDDYMLHILNNSLQILSSVCFQVPLEYIRGLHKTYSKRTLPPGLILKKSGIPGAGLGVFAAMDIPSGTVFGPYKGKIHHGKIRGRSSDFSWQVSMAFFKTIHFTHRHTNTHTQHKDRKTANGSEHACVFISQ